MIGKTLFLYILRQYLLSVFSVFIGCFALVSIVDFLEMLRKFGDVPGIKAVTILLLTLARVPYFVELILPFAVLIGSMICLVGLSRKLELVVIRASGISAWQFLSPALVGAFLIGVFFTFIYNPAAVALREYGQNYESEFLKGRSNNSVKSFWIRQQSGAGQTVMQAVTGAKQGRLLTGVTIYRFNASGQFTDRIDAEKAELEKGHWRIENVEITALSGIPLKEKVTYIETALSEEQVRDSFIAPDMVSYLELPKYIDITQKAGLSATRFELQYSVLNARPLLLIAMTLLAACGSMKFFRLGGLTETIIAGIVTGFLLYVGAEIAGNLGRSGFVDPTVAGWSPAVIGTLIGLKMLLTREDG